VQQQADAEGNINWDVHYVDGTIVRAHQHAVGSPRGTEAEALGRSQGGFSTKVHLRAADETHLMTLVLSPGQRHETLGFEPLMSGGAVKRRGRGRPKQRPGRIVGDKAYSSRKIRAYWRRLGIPITIPLKVNEHRSGPFDRSIYRMRERVERLINRLKQKRQIATRALITASATFDHPEQSQRFLNALCRWFSSAFVLREVPIGWPMP